MPAETDTQPLELDAPGAPQGVPVPSLDAQPPEGEIVGLRAPQELTPAPRKRGRPRKDAPLSMTPNAIRKRKRKAEAQAQGGTSKKGARDPDAPKSTPGASGPRRAPGVPLPPELEAGELEAGELTEAQELAQLAGVLALTFSTLTALAGEPWPIEEGEARQLGDAWAPVLHPYLGTMGENAPLFTAAVATFGVFAPRAVTWYHGRQARQLPPAPPEIVPPTPTPGERTGAEVPGATPPPAPPAPAPGSGPQVGGYEIKPPKKRPAPK